MRHGCTRYIPFPEVSINKDAAPLSNQYRLIRADGTEITFLGKISINEICRLIGCDTLDTVTIDRRRQTVMFDDDTGMVDGKPVNPKATALYHAVSKPGNAYSSMGTRRLSRREGSRDAEIRTVKTLKSSPGWLIPRQADVLEARTAPH